MTCLIFFKLRVLNLEKLAFMSEIGVEDGARHVRILKGGIAKWILVVLNICYPGIFFSCNLI